MTNPQEDLWPEDIGTDLTERAPLLILREQADKLGERMGNVIEAQVSAAPHYIERTSLEIRFTIVAAALGGYEYELLSVTQPVDLYPATITFEGQRLEAKNEAEFKQHLQGIFQSARTRRLIGNLVSQSKSV